MALKMSPRQRNLLAEAARGSGKLSRHPGCTDWLSLVTLCRKGMMTGAHGQFSAFEITDAGREYVKGDTL